jgi:hypothetical protein
LHKAIKATPSGSAAGESRVLRFCLALATIASYLTMMFFLIHSAREAAQAGVAAAEFSPAMIALASSMAFSVMITGLFVFVRQGD